MKFLKKESANEGICEMWMDSNMKLNRVFLVQISIKYEIDNDRAWSHESITYCYCGRRTCRYCSVRFDDVLCIQTKVNWPCLSKRNWYISSFFRFQSLWSSPVKSNTISDDENSSEVHVKHRKMPLSFPVDHHSDTISWNSESSEHHDQMTVLVNLIHMKSFYLKILLFV